MVILTGQAIQNGLTALKECFWAPAKAQSSSPVLSDAFGPRLENTATSAGYSSVDIINLAASIITIILTLLGAAFLLIIIYSGLKWMNSGGNEQAIEKAKSTIKQAIIGIMVVVGAYAISYYLINFLTK